MSTRKDDRSHTTKPPRRLTPFELGKGAHVIVGSLERLPYGPGWRQEEYIRGFCMAQALVDGFKDAPGAD